MKSYVGIHDHYMDPASINIAAYEPYESFFGTIKAKHERERLNILDVGCGNGVFMGECLKRGHAVSGVEINRNNERYMPAYIAERVTFSAVEHLSPPDRLFDVITFWDSFEHINDPFSLLDRILPFLAKNGLVFVRVNNSFDVFNFLTAAALNLWPNLGRKLLKSCFNLPQHCWNFNPRAMCLLTAGAGWRILDFRITETPAERLTPSPWLRLAISAAYLVNRLISGGKIGEYYLVPGDGKGEP